MLQPILTNSTSKFTDICISYNSHTLTYSSYLGLALLENTPSQKDCIPFKMLVGRCKNAGAKLCELQKQFNLDPKTIKKFAQALKSNSEEEVARIFAGKSHNKKVTPEIFRFIRDQYESKSLYGKNYRHQIIEKVAKVFSVNLSKVCMSGIFKSIKNEFTKLAQNEENSRVSLPLSAPKNTADISTELSVINSYKRDDAEQLPSFLGTNISTSVQYDDAFRFLKFTEFSQFKQGESRVLIQHAGLVLFGRNIGKFSDIQRQFIYQLLLGAVNIEQSKTLCQSSLDYFSDLPCKTLQSQREALDSLASLEEVLQLYRLNNSLLIDGPNRGYLFYFDPHTKEYTGLLKILKGWCGRTHKTAKVINLDCFHSESAHPCFIQHFSPFYDMRERFFMSLKIFDELFDEDKRIGRTFVIDRAIYGVECLGKFLQNYVITWEKGFDSKIVTIDWENDNSLINFDRYRVKNSITKKDKPENENLKISFSCHEEEWQKVKGFRRIIVKAIRKTSTVILSVICSNPDMSVADIVWAIFNRWLQENDFKYMDINFGINELDSRSRSTFMEQKDEFKDRLIASPEYTKQREKLSQEKNRFSKHLLKTRGKQKELSDSEFRLVIKQKTLDKKRRNKNHNKLVIKELEKDIKKLEKKINTVKSKLSEFEISTIEFDKNIAKREADTSKMLRQESRLELLIKDNYSLLGLRRKSYMDALRVCAANLFRDLHLEYRGIYNNFRDDHVQLRMLSQCSGVLIQQEKIVEMQLWVPGSIQARVLESMRIFVRKISESCQFKNQKRLIISLVDGPLQQ